MRYYPKRKTALEILLGLRYKPSNRGYVRALNNVNRLHALVGLDGDIDLHFDEPHPEDKSKHKSRKFCKTVEREIVRFKKIDVSERWHIRLLDRFLLGLNKTKE